MHDTVTKTTSTTDASIVKETPTGEDDDGEYLRVPISSTNADRDGDRFSEDGLKDLRDQIRETSKPVFENHGIGEGGLLGVRYDWKGIIGSQDDAEIAEDGDAKTLYSFIKTNDESEEGQLFRDYVEAGMPVGLSIGFRPLDYESNDDDENVFHETDLLETSAVGIQSNQESVAGRDAPTVEAVAKGVAARVDADLDEDTIAKAIVSEASATETGPIGGLGLRDRGADSEQQYHDHEPDETHHDPDMDDDTKELMERLTAIQENEQEKRIELEQRVADLEADDGEDDPEAGKDAEPNGGDGDDPTDDEVAELRSEVEELRDTLEDGDGAEDAETTTAKELNEKKDADEPAAGQEPI
jgi:hypothetical protein